MSSHARYRHDEGDAHRQRREEPISRSKGTAANTLSNGLAGLGRWEEALAASQEAVTIRRELAARWPDAYQQELEQSLQVVAWLKQSTDVENVSPEEPKT